MADEALEAAVAHHRAGRLAEAEVGYGLVLRADPGNVRALHNLGVLLLRRKEIEPAVAMLAQAYETAPEGFPAWTSYAEGLIAAERFDAAAEVLARSGSGPQAAGLELRLQRAWGLVLLRDERHAEAEARLCRAAELETDEAAKAELMLVRAAALTRLGRTSEAEACREAAANAEGMRYHALLHQAFVQAMQRRNDEALETLGQAIALKPDEALAYYRRAFIRLVRHDFAGGWRDYERRFWVDDFIASAGVVSTQIRDALTIDGRPDELTGRRVLLLAEQGVGDRIMFASCIPDLLQSVAEVTCVCDARLVRLFEASFPQLKLLPVPGATARLSDYDTVLAMGSLGRLYRNRIEDFRGAPFLAPRPAVRAAWAARLGPKPKGLRIGLSWRGGTDRSGGSRRSLSLEQLTPLLSLPDCEFVNLQYGDTRGELAAAGPLAGAIRSFPAAEMEDFEDLAALVAELDVVVSVQTALVHLSGAIGKECLTMVPYSPEWRYGLEGSTMPWYRSVRLIRQAEPGGWEPVIRQVTDVLRARL